MTRYRISVYGMVYKLEEGVPYVYNFCDPEWVVSEDAADAFYEGSESWEATCKEALDAIRERCTLDFPLTKSVLEQLNKEELIALMYAEDGAMGCPGEIMVMDDRFRLFRTVCYNDKELSQMEVTALFDGFDHLDGWMAPDTLWVTLNNQTWVYFNLGMGNHLYMRRDFYYSIGNDLFDVDQSKRYRKWNDLFHSKPEKTEKR